MQYDIKIQRFDYYFIPKFFFYKYQNEKEFQFYIYNFEKNILIIVFYKDKNKIKRFKNILKKKNNYK